MSLFLLIVSSFGWRQYFCVISWHKVANIETVSMVLYHIMPFWLVDVHIIWLWCLLLWKGRHIRDGMHVSVATWNIMWSIFSFSRLLILQVSIPTVALLASLLLLQPLPLPLAMAISSGASSSCCALSPARNWGSRWWAFVWPMTSSLSTR